MGMQAYSTAIGVCAFVCVGECHAESKPAHRGSGACACVCVGECQAESLPAHRGSGLCVCRRVSSVSTAADPWRQEMLGVRQAAQVVRAFACFASLLLYSCKKKTALFHGSSESTWMDVNLLHFTLGKLTFLDRPGHSGESLCRALTSKCRSVAVSHYSDVVINHDQSLLRRVQCGF